MKNQKPRMHFSNHFPKTVEVLSVKKQLIYFIFETFMTSICEKKISAEKYGLFMQNKCLYTISSF